jgi:hypothetical protein
VPIHNIKVSKQSVTAVSKKELPQLATALANFYIIKVKPSSASAGVHCKPSYFHPSSEPGLLKSQPN